MPAHSQRRGLLFWLAVIVPILFLGFAILAVWANWQTGAGEIGFHGQIALAGAAIFSLGLTFLLVWLMIASHRSGADERTGRPDDPADRQRRGGY